MSLFSSLFKPKPDKWQQILDSRQKKYFELTPSPQIKIDRRFSQMNAQTYYRQYNESINLIGNTKKPQVFFERYDFALTRIIGLIYMQKYVKMEGSNLSKIADDLIQNKQLFVVQLIDRAYEELKTKVYTLKTKSSKLKNIQKFEESFEPYFIEMREDNQRYVHALASGLRQSIEKEKY